MIYKDFFFLFTIKSLYHYSALLMKLFYFNEESATIALRKFSPVKGLKTILGRIPCPGIVSLVKEIKVTGFLKLKKIIGGV